MWYTNVIHAFITPVVTLHNTNMKELKLQGCKP